LALGQGKAIPSSRSVGYPGSMSNTEDRLLTLETKVAYQDKHIAELNQVVVELNEAVTTLTARLEASERMLQAEFGSREIPNEKPPHY
jgi:SlyX protein